MNDDNKQFLTRHADTLRMLREIPDDGKFTDAQLADLTTHPKRAIRIAGKEGCDCSNLTKLVERIESRDFAALGELIEPARLEIYGMIDGTSPTAKPIEMVRSNPDIPACYDDAERRFAGLVLDNRIAIRKRIGKSPDIREAMAIHAKIQKSVARIERVICQPEIPKLAITPAQLRDERDDALLERFDVNNKTHPSYPELAAWLESVAAAKDWTPIEPSSMRDALLRAWGRLKPGESWPFDGRGKGKQTANKEIRK